MCTVPVTPGGSCTLSDSSAPESRLRPDNHLIEGHSFGVGPQSRKPAVEPLIAVAHHAVILRTGAPGVPCLGGRSSAVLELIPAAGPLVREAMSKITSDRPPSARATSAKRWPPPPAVTHVPRVGTSATMASTSAGGQAGFPGTRSADGRAEPRHPRWPRAREPAKAVSFWDNTALWGRAKVV
jgi:hypothetical protein